MLSGDLEEKWYKRNIISKSTQALGFADYIDIVGLRLGKVEESLRPLKKKTDRLKWRQS